jgi:hypothetical protein
MTTATVAGLLMIVVAIAFNAAFALLAARFDYPDILREPTADVLAKFPLAGHRSCCFGGPSRSPHGGQSGQIARSPELTLRQFVGAEASDRDGYAVEAVYSG